MRATIVGKYKILAPYHNTPTTTPAIGPSISTMITMTAISPTSATMSTFTLCTLPSVFIAELMLCQRSGRVHANWLLTGTPTGRVAAVYLCI